MLRRVADDEAAEEAAELLQYRLLAQMFAQAGTWAATGAALIAGLISAETESPTETPAEETGDCVMGVNVCLPLFGSPGQEMDEGSPVKGRDLRKLAADGRVKTAERLGKRLHADLVFIYKRRSRHEANKIEEMRVVGDVRGRPCVMIDDMIDTAGTMSDAARALAAEGAGDIYAVATHPILSGKADLLKTLGLTTSTGAGTPGSWGSRSSAGRW